MSKWDFELMSEQDATRILSGKDHAAEGYSDVVRAVRRRVVEAMTATTAAFVERKAQLIAAGVGDAAADRFVRNELGISGNGVEIGEADARKLEKAEQARITEVFQAFNFRVRNLSQYRPSKVAPGLPDLFVTHRVLPIGFLWESKRQKGGVYSDEQNEFRQDCERCGIGCFGGTGAGRTATPRRAVRASRVPLTPIAPLRRLWAHRGPIPRPP